MMRYLHCKCFVHHGRVSSELSLNIHLLDHNNNPRRTTKVVEASRTLATMKLFIAGSNSCEPSLTAPAVGVAELSILVVAEASECDGSLATEDPADDVV